MRIDLSDLEGALIQAIRAHPEVRMERITLEGGEFLRVTVEPPEGPSRSVRVTCGDLPEIGRVLSLRWSSYNSPSEVDNCDGGTFGDQEFILRAIQHFILEGLPWRAVPEFKVTTDRRED